MRMQKIFAVLILAALVLAVCTAAIADTQRVLDRAKAKNIALITREQAIAIADKELAAKNIKAVLNDADLDNEAGKYYNGSDFRPVYELEYKAAGGLEYDIDVDAVTGEILKFKADD
ncbi:MAG: PepSY domain-containing protein [Synergistaceae bacterium]|nr:PepSY domain-containing protein [Synergistaceae bacterium]